MGSGVYRTGGAIEKGDPGEYRVGWAWGDALSRGGNSGARAFVRERQQPALATGPGEGRRGGEREGEEEGEEGVGHCIFSLRT